MRRIALGKVGYGGDPSNRFNIGGVGDRYRPRLAGGLRANGGRPAVFSARSERPASCGDAEHSLARAGRATDWSQASGYERERAATQIGSADLLPVQTDTPTKARATPGSGDARARSTRGGQHPSPNADQIAPEAKPVPPPPPAGVAGAPTSLVEYVTGPNSPNHTLERFGISGTDLGIPWDNGDPGNPQVLMAFGDTFGYCACGASSGDTTFSSAARTVISRTGCTCRTEYRTTHTPAHRYGRRAFPNKSSTASTRHATRPESFRPPRCRLAERNT